MRSRTLLVPAPRPRPAPRSTTGVTGRISPCEMDVLMFAYEVRAVDSSASDAPFPVPAYIPTGGHALSMYRCARRLELMGLLDLATTVRPNAEDGYNPHHRPSHYAWHVTLTRAGEERVSHELAGTLPSASANTMLNRMERWGPTA